MEHDRKVIISVGNSRKDLVWRQNSLTVSELYERLRNPARSTELLSDYMKLPKKQQDELKDVGGFVGGTLNGTRRKANNVTGRDIITLDFDNIPGWQTEDVIAKVEALSCSFCVYSTRKHTPARPRLRVIIPLDRTVTPDEYEPCARRVASSIGISMADPTTFEVCRLMYWPSCSSDSEYVYYNDQMLASIARLDQKQTDMDKDIKEIKSDVKTIAEKPGKRWDAIVDKVLLAIVAALVCYALSQIGLG